MTEDDLRSWYLRYFAQLNDHRIDGMDEFIADRANDYEYGLRHLTGPWWGCRPALQRLAAAQDEPDDLAAVRHPYRQRAGGVESESQPV